MNEAKGEAKKANRLPLADQARAMEWLREHREQAGREPQTGIAQRLSEFLGRPVTTANLGTVAQAAGVMLRGYSETVDLVAKVRITETELLALAERVKALEVQAAALAERVKAHEARVAAAAGVTYPTGRED